MRPSESMHETGVPQIEASVPFGFSCLAIPKWGKSSFLDQTLLFIYASNLNSTEVIPHCQKWKGVRHIESSPDRCESARPSCPFSTPWAKFPKQNGERPISFRRPTTCRFHLEFVQVRTKSPTPPRWPLHPPAPSKEHQGRGTRRGRKIGMKPTLCKYGALFLPTKQRRFEWKQEETCHALSSRKSVRKPQALRNVFPTVAYLCFLLKTKYELTNEVQFLQVQASTCFDGAIIQQGALEVEYEMTQQATTN